MAVGSELESASPDDLARSNRLDCMIPEAIPATKATGPTMYSNDRLRLRKF